MTVEEKLRGDKSNDPNFSFKELYASRLLRLEKNSIGETVANCQILILSDAVVDEYHQAHTPQSLEYNKDKIEYLDLPFENVFVEALNRDLGSVQLSASRRDTGALVANIYTKTSSENGYYTAVRVWIDQKANKLEFDETALTDADLWLVETINRKRNGFAKCGFATRNRHTGHRFIREIVYCDRVDRLRAGRPKIDRKPFKYSHQYDVRGHWRRIKGIGKNVAGEYCMPKVTWVRGFLKGSGEYTRKLRLIK